MNYKNLTFVDIGLIKLAVLSAAFFLISVWPSLANWVTNTSWILFLVVAVVFAIKPMMAVCKK